MIYRGICHQKGRADRIKWICHNMYIKKGNWICICDNPCSSAKIGRTSYTYDNIDFRMFTGIQRDSDDWNMCIAGRKSRHHFTT